MCFLWAAVIKGAEYYQTMSGSTPDIVIGGFHLYSPRTGECLPEPVIMDLAANLPDAVYYTGHCTGDKALEILTRELREIHPLMTGTVIEA